ncbi:unnamed protein product, partial [Phaeothamnion confervicola]
LSAWIVVLLCSLPPRHLSEKQHEMMDPCQPAYEAEALTALDKINLDANSIEEDVRERAHATATYKQRPGERLPEDAGAAIEQMPEPMQSALIRHAEVLEHYKGARTKRWG